MSDIDRQIEHLVTAFVTELIILVRQAAIDAVAEQPELTLGTHP